MKQIVQDMKSGETRLEEVPAPQVESGRVLIRTSRSLVSLGTERMLVEFGRAGLLDKARQQPDKVRQVLDKIRTDGVVPTVEAVFNKLGQPLPLGYCNVGQVVDVGRGVTEFRVGDRVVSNGPHAEFVCVPKNLVAKIPDEVSDDAAAFTVIGSIGLQGVRLLRPELGETVVVVGLGLIGLMAAQLLKANGCCVIGVDFDASKVALARRYGVEVVNPQVDGSPVEFVRARTGGAGADGVLITASTKTDEVMHEACEMSRKRGRIVLVGVVGLNLRRDDFYRKELSFQVSCSYGPGRYDDEYERKGHDYPAAFVRWTEKRNFEAVLRAIATGALEVESMMTERCPLAEFETIYGDLRKAGAIASLLVYPQDASPARSVSVEPAHAGAAGGKLGLIGAGNFASATMAPALRKAGAAVKAVASAGGLSAKILAKKLHAEVATSDVREVLTDPEVTMVVIATRHHLHAPMALDALKARKSVFVEKPLCLREDELANIEAAYRAAGSGVTLNVGFNRRFSPFTAKLKSLLGPGPKNIVATMNAGFIPADSWVHDMETGGGRIVGEACHLIDLCAFLADSPIVAVCMNAMGEHPTENTDNASLLLHLADGTNAVVNYFSNGSKACAKERVEVYDAGRILVLDNWRVLTGYGVPGFSRMKGAMDKGHSAQFAALARLARDGGPALTEFEGVLNTTRAAFACIRSLKTKSWVEL